jgi:hypothetical protein
MARKSKGLCGPANTYSTIMILMYITTLIGTFVNKSSVSDELRRQMYSPQGIATYAIKVAISVGILSLLCTYKCYCLANIFVLFAILAYLGVLLYLIAILVGVDVTKKDHDAKKQAHKAQAHHQAQQEHESAPEGFSI